MKNIYILTYEDVILSSAAAALDILSRTNDILRSNGQSPAFQVELVSERHKNVALNEATQFFCQRTLSDTPPSSDGHRHHLIIVPAFGNSWDVVRGKNPGAIKWLSQHYEAGSEIASMCVGSYFLAEAGILNGKSCTSHWKAISDMQLRFPRIKLEPDTVVTDNDGIYTGGGAFSSLNLLLYLVEKFCGHETGLLVSKNFSIHRDHINQAHFSVFKGLNQHGDRAVLQAQNFIEQHFQQDISVEQAAAAANMSLRNFIRRFKQATQYTPVEYIQRVRIESAKKLLEDGHDNIQKLMLDVGYNDVKTFRNVFKRITGTTPQSYRQKYAR